MRKYFFSYERANYTEGKKSIDSEKMEKNSGKNAVERHMMRKLKEKDIPIN